MLRNINIKFSDQITCVVLCKKCFENILFWSPTFFHTKQHKYHFNTKLDKYVENLYMFVTKIFPEFFEIFLFFIFSI